MEIKYGTTRIAFLIGRYCIKIPNFTHQYTHGLLGLVNNVEEDVWASMYNPNLAKVYFACPGGFFNIMERTIPLTELEFNQLDYKKFITERMSLGQLPIENKRDSFGKRKNGKIVAIDFH